MELGCLQIKQTSLYIIKIYQIDKSLKAVNFNKKFLLMINLSYILLLSGDPYKLAP